MRTIAAAATPLTAAGAIGIIRLSGDEALRIVKKIFISREPGWENPEPRRMYLGTVETERLKDKAFCVYCKAPKSFTGEDVVELQLHGGVTVLRAVLRALTEAGAAPAQPGEFTKRAFLNGKMSIAEAEGIADMIQAESEAGAMQAYRMMAGELSEGISACENLLLTADANIEAVLDYPEELEEDLRKPTLQLLEEACARLQTLLDNAAGRKYVTDGVTVAIAGLTNVGKSSLLNALLKEDRAIVTDIAGTTRDTLRESIELNGVKIYFLDTAGIRESIDPVESIGIGKARKAAASADLILFVTDLSLEETKEEKDLLASFDRDKTILIGNKSDIKRYARPVDIELEAKTGRGTEALLTLIPQKLRLENAAAGAILTRDRHVYAVQAAVRALDSAIGQYDFLTPDLLAVEVKAALRALTEITGRDLEEAVVDTIFSQFCVGK